MNQMMDYAYTILEYCVIIMITSSIVVTSSLKAMQLYTYSAQGSAKCIKGPLPTRLVYVAVLRILTKQRKEDNEE